MSSRRKWQKSQWLGPALGAGLSAGATAAGVGSLAPAGSMFGGWLGDLIKTYTGFGEYHVGQNALYEGSQAPYVRNHDYTNGTLISHKEYVMDVITSSTVGAFKIQSFALNPGQSSTCEFLAQIASNYEQYVIEGMLFVFRSMSADALNSTNTALGTVIMATDYNSLDAPFGSKAEMESTQYSMSGRPSSNMIHPIECDPSKTPLDMLYVRTGARPVGSDPRFYDLGNFQLATQGFQAASVNIGELWITYQVALLKPRLYASLGLFNDYYHHRGQSSMAAILGFIDASLILDPRSNMSPSFVYTTNEVVVTLPSYPMPTTYFVTANWIPSVASISPTRNFYAVSNCVINILDYFGFATVNCPQAAVAGCTAFDGIFIVQASGSSLSPSFRMVVNALPAAATTCNFVIMQIPNP